MKYIQYTKMRSINSPEMGGESASERSDKTSDNLVQALQVQKDTQSKLEGLAAKMLKDVGVTMEVPNIKERVHEASQKAIAPRYEQLLHTILS